MLLLANRSVHVHLGRPQTQWGWAYINYFYSVDAPLGSCCYWIAGIVSLYDKNGEYLFASYFRDWIAVLSMNSTLIWTRIQNCLLKPYGNRFFTQQNIDLHFVFCELLWREHHALE